MSAEKVMKLPRIKMISPLIPTVAEHKKRGWNWIAFGISRAHDAAIEVQEVGLVVDHGAELDSR